MELRSIPALFAALLWLAGCTTVTSPLPAPRPLPLEGFEGSYSNFSQAIMADTPENIIDLEIERLGGVSFLLFRVTRTFRDSGVSQARLYRFDPAPDDGQAQLRIRILNEAQAAAELEELLDLAASGFDPGCVIALAVAEGRMRGHTDPATCRFAHPLHGDTGVFRQVAMGDGQLALDEFLVDADDDPVGELRRYVFDRHREFRAQGAFRLPGPDGELGPWRMSTVVEMRDDGRRATLFDGDGGPIGYSLQLARLEWQPQQPYYLRLAAYQVETGALQAYYWAEPDAELIEFNRDWLQIRVEDAARQASE